MSLLDRQILRIAIPSIVSNITVPLLALADTAIAGHMGRMEYIGAVALGGTSFSMVYWLFGFLRMGTGGLTAQSCGAGDTAESMRVLLRSLALAALVGLSIIVLRRPIGDAVFPLLNASGDTAALARRYYDVLVWGAPAVLAMYSVTGWFVGMQNARFPMYVAVAQNAVNIAVSVSLVWGFGLRIEGVAAGTLVAQYAGLLLAAAFWLSRYRAYWTAAGRKGLLRRDALARFFSVNRDIFLRTLCLIAVSSYFTAAGAAHGSLTLAANTLLMQFFLIFSYVSDGLAYAGEALGGRCCGAGDRAGFQALTRRLFAYGALTAAAFSLLYALGGESLLSLLTDDTPVVAAASAYLPYAAAIPVAGVAAFLFDGLFIGATRTGFMLLSMAAATMVFFAMETLFPASNHALWLAYLAYLAVRGAAQAFLYPRTVKGIRRANGMR